MISTDGEKERIEKKRLFQGIFDVAKTAIF